MTSSHADGRSERRKAGRGKRRAGEQDACGEQNEQDEEGEQRNKAERLKKGAKESV